MTKDRMDRRQFLKIASLGVTSLVTGCTIASPKQTTAKKPNVVYIFADQWRPQSIGYAGNSDVITPNLDKLAAQSVNMTTAVSCCPVCSPYRASLMTGQYPLTNGVFLNDVDFKTDAASLAGTYKSAGYNTGYIGKWHLSGLERSAFIPKEKRMGFDFFQAANCNHYYNKSFYYGDKPEKFYWKGYDAIAQTKVANKYISDHATDDKPFLLVLSWGPPHAPYHSAPKKYKALYKDKKIALRPNIPDKSKKKALEEIRGYYAHITALDDCMASILKTLKLAGIEKDTIVVFTSDHGDMLRSQGHVKKQRPWDESILVPFLLRYPAVLGEKPKVINSPFNSPDIMPTLLGLSDIDIPETVEGKDFSAIMKGSEEPKDDAALIMCPWPFGQYIRDPKGHPNPKFGADWGGGREWRGVRTVRYTYVRDLNGPWLMYDNEKDPYQLNNLVNNAQYSSLQKKLDETLNKKLKETNDEFLPGENYVKKWGYKVDKLGSIPFKW